MRLAKIIRTSARSALALQRADGSFPPGHNGPYRDPETPVRNTAHWLVTLCKGYELWGDRSFMEAALQAANYLSSPQARPMQATFFCRRNPEKDFANGLIGQAWVIEALSVASETLNDRSYRRLAEEVFLLHPFDHRIGLWRRVNVDGSYASFDLTFNHQLWFAAAGSLLDSGPDGTIGSRVRRFLDRALASHWKVAPSGRIIHHIPPLSPGRRISRALQRLPNPLVVARAMAHKEIGYHAFNLYAFAILKQQVPDHPLWQRPRLAAALRFVERDAYIRGLEDNEFGYPYNPPGIEVAFALSVFGAASPVDVGSASVVWLSRQLERTFDLASGLMQRNTGDPYMLAARIYEATRLPDLSLEVDGLR